MKQRNERVDHLSSTKQTSHLHITRRETTVEPALDKIHEDQLKAQNLSLFRHLESGWNLNGILRAFRSRAFRSRALIDDDDEASSGRPALCRPPSTQRGSSSPISPQRKLSLNVRRFANNLALLKQHRVDRKKARHIKKFYLYVTLLWLSSLGTFLWAPCWISLWSSSRIVRSYWIKGIIHKELTRHKLEEVTRPNLQFLVVVSLVFALLQSIPLSMNISDPAARGNSVAGVATFALWNHFNGAWCFMVMTRNHHMSTFASGQAAQTCNNQLYFFSMLASFQACFSCLSAILASRALRIIGRAKVAVHPIESFESAPCSAPLQIESGTTNPGGGTKSYSQCLGDTWNRHTRILLHVTGVLIGFVVPLFIAANFTFNLQFIHGRLTHCGRSGLANCVNPVSICGWAFAGLLAAFGVPAFAVCFGRHSDAGGLSKLLHGSLQESSSSSETKFREAAKLITGEDRLAAKGMHTILGWQTEHLQHWAIFKLPSEHGDDYLYAPGVQAIIQEVNEFGTPDDKEILHYILHEPAGKSQKVFKECTMAMPMDCNADGRVHYQRICDGQENRPKRKDDTMRFRDFLDHVDSQDSGLEARHVLALRLYTTAFFARLNTPFYKDENGDYYKKVNTPIHPGCCKRGPKGEEFDVAGKYQFAATMMSICDAASRLRGKGRVPNTESKAPAHEKSNRFQKAVHLVQARHRSETVHAKILWRGIKGVEATQAFKEHGGTYLGPISTTTKLPVALKYAYATDQRKGLLLKIIPRNFMSRGVTLGYLSCFPDEEEYLYPPCTFFKPNGKVDKQIYEEVEYEIIECEPDFGNNAA